MAPSSHLPSNSSSRPLFKLEYDIETLDVLFAFELTLAAELEDRGIQYETEIAIGPDHYSITYYVYATPE